ncbi:MAG: hypothetical protein NT167_04675, partial [Verrucomicrobia bacterium]|nr:hypothetical protein [Verrucomicrobiota bacterium]
MLAALGMFLSMGSTAQALEIISPPTRQTVCAPSPATFTVVAAGIPELLYQWSVSEITATVGTLSPTATMPATRSP